MKNEKQIYATLYSSLGYQPSLGEGSRQNQNKAYALSTFMLYGMTW